MVLSARRKVVSRKACSRRGSQSTSRGHNNADDRFASSVDDVAAQAVKAGAKAAGAVIDDAAVTPKYVHGFEASRELPIIWKITKGSFKNKLVYLLPVGLLLSNFAPWLIAPLLMLGGKRIYAC